MNINHFKKFTKIFRRNKYYCPVCRNSVPTFNILSTSYLEQLSQNECIHNIFRFETLNTILYSCPKCGASDRNRLAALYLTELKGLRSKKILDVAPSKQLNRFIKSFHPAEYRTIDLYMDNVDEQADIQNLHNYKDENYDLVICSHVLEHIEDDQKAIGEIYRILNKGGQAIFMAPIHLDLDEDYENFSIKEEKDKWKHFAQNDHLRVYSKSGFISKIQYAGFEVNQFNEDFFGKEKFIKTGIHRNSVLYIAKKIIL